MLINSDVLKQAIFGAVRIEEEDGFLRPCRFTRTQLERRAGEDGYILRAGASSCMTIDFETDATQLDFDYRVRIGAGKKLCFFDILVDGRLMFHTGKRNILEDEGHISFSMTEGKKRVTVYFPCLYEVRVKNFCLNDGALFEPVKKAKKILFFGDSITQGYSSDCPSLAYANQIVRRYDAACVNQAIGGSCFNEDYLEEGMSVDADMVIVAYGTNDWAKGIDLKGNAEAYLRKLTKIYKDSRIYLLLPIWRGDQEREEAVMTFYEARELLRKVGESFSAVTVIDGIDFVPHESWYFEDERLHPNDIGFMYYAEALGRELDRSLR